MTTIVIIGDVGGCADELAQFAWDNREGFQATPMAIDEAVQYAIANPGPILLADVADNTGAKEVMCIQVLGGSRRRVAHLGDIIKVSIKDAIPRGRVKKGEVYNAVVGRTAQGVRRPDGSGIKFDGNAAVFLGKTRSHRPF